MWTQAFSKRAPSTTRTSLLQQLTGIGWQIVILFVIQPLRGPLSIIRAGTDRKDTMKRLAKLTFIALAIGVVFSVAAAFVAEPEPDISVSGIVRAKIGR